MSENTSEDEQIPMADEDEEIENNCASSSVRCAPQEVASTTTNLTTVPVLESLSPRSQDGGDPESGNNSQQQSAHDTQRYASKQQRETATATSNSLAST